MLPLLELHTSWHAKLVQLAMRRNDDNPGEQDSAKGELADRLSAPLQIDNHMDRFMLLQCLERFQEEIDVRNYDMNGKVLEKSGTVLFGLQVPGLAENRPSVVIGDLLKVTKANDPRSAPSHPPVAVDGVSW